MKRLFVIGYFLSVCALANAQAQYEKRVTSGVTNTGDATVADVASSKTFSSASLTNAIGTSTKNATVPGDSPMQPPQAFVTAMNLVLAQERTSNFASCGITAFDPTTTANIANDTTEINLSGNALTNVDAILAACVALPVTNANIDLSGGTNAIPTKDTYGVWDSGLSSMNGPYSVRGTLNGKNYYNKVGQATSTTLYALVWSNTGAGLKWNVATPDLAIFVNESVRPAPTVGLANVAQKTLENDLGCSVTTNSVLAPALLVLSSFFGILHRRSALRRRAVSLADLCPPTSDRWQ